MSFVRNCCWLIVLLTLVGCSGIMDDLNPSGTNKVPAVVPGTTGPGVGQNAPDFTISDTLGSSVNLATAMTGTGVKGVVLYFTMWCPLCDTHMSHMQDSVIPFFPDVVFFAVDYVSGTVTDARNAELSSGFSGSRFHVLADIGAQVALEYNATMGTTVVIDRTGVIRMNEDFKDGSRLTATLTALP